jgi:hypothetical protein
VKRQFINKSNTLHLTLVGRSSDSIERARLKLLIISGIVSSPFLTLLVLPLLYRMAYGKQEAKDPKELHAAVPLPVLKP